MEKVVLECIKKCNVIVLRQLLQSTNINLNKPLSNGSTVLHEILSLKDNKKEKYDMIRYLMIEANVDPNICNCINETALHYLIENKWEGEDGLSEEIFELFLNTGYDIHRNDQQQNNLLYLCIRNKRLRYLTLLIKNGADVNYKNFYGNALVHSCAVLISDEKPLRDLFELGYFDLNIKTKRNESLFDLALKNVELAAVWVILDYDIEFDDTKLHNQLSYLYHDSKKYSLMCHMLYAIHKNYPGEATDRLNGLYLEILVDPCEEIEKLQIIFMLPSNISFYDLIMTDINRSTPMFKIFTSTWFEQIDIFWDNAAITQTFPLFHEVIIRKLMCLKQRFMEFKKFIYLTYNKKSTYHIPMLYTQELKDIRPLIICMAFDIHKFTICEETLYESIEYATIVC